MPAAHPVLRKERRPAGAATPLSRERWTEAATKVLVSEGIDHVRVDVLAAELGVTRGSFYHHFKDREDLLHSVLAAWKERATESQNRRLANEQAGPRQQLHDILHLPFHGRAALNAANIELAIRAWARRDGMARQAVDEADASRLQTLHQQFCLLGFPSDEAESRSALLYCFLISNALVPVLAEPSKLAARMEFFEALLTSRST